MLDGILEGMKLKISKGNSKIGDVPNLSLPPIITCIPDAPCAGICYAKNAYNRWPAVRNAWDYNLELYKGEPEKFWYDLCLYLSVQSPQRFRLFVGGDFPDEHFFRRVVSIFSTYNNTSVLCFTKRYGMVAKYIHCVPDNVNLIISTWPGLELPELIQYLPSAWLDGDLRFEEVFPKNPYIHCPGSCDVCGHQCWYAVSPNLPVVFKRH